MGRFRSHVEWTRPNQKAAMIQTNEDRDPVEELAEEFLERRRQGEAVTLDDYALQYPQWSHRIRDLFPMLLMVEDGSVVKGEGTPKRHRRCHSSSIRTSAGDSPSPLG